MTTETVLTDSTQTAVDDAVAAALGSAAYDCMRVWSAWSYGTMGPDDFLPVADDSDRVREISDAAIQAVLQSPEVQKMQVDAERYRWLRSSHVGPESLSSLHQWVNDDCNPPYTELKYGDELDTAIDAAMEKQP